MRGAVRRLAARLVNAELETSELERLSEDDRRYLSSAYDDSAPLPPGAVGYLNESNPRLEALRREYAGLELPALAHSRWRRSAVDEFLDLRHFRGESLITWHYRETRRVTELKYFLLLRYVAERDRLGLIEKLTEDGAFGCWTCRFAGCEPVSRDLLDSVNEISFLERQVGAECLGGMRILDIGAGYGRLAHRMSAAFPALNDYCCVDAIPESTFISEYYLRHRNSGPPARVISLPEMIELEPGRFDLAINIHSFSECTLAAVRWWIDQLVRLGVPRLFLIPNEPDELLALEADGSRPNFESVLSEAGYRPVANEPVIADQAVRELLRLEDTFYMFERRTEA